MGSSERTLGSPRPRDEVVDYIGKWTARAESPVKRILAWMSLPTSKYHLWKQHYGRPHAHNSHIPRDGWLVAWEKQAIVDYHRKFPLEGYRRVTYIMLDQDVVAVSPPVSTESSRGWACSTQQGAPSKKGKGFVQPSKPMNMAIDISYLNIAGTFYFLGPVLDGYSRAIVHWEIRETMKEPEIETIVRRALEKYLGNKPRIISDNGPQFIAKDFKQFIRLAGITDVRTSPDYPQSNGKLERWHGTLKNEEFRNKAPRDVEEAHRIVDNFVTHYNEVRLHSALGYIAPTTSSPAVMPRSSPIAMPSSRLLGRADSVPSHVPPLNLSRSGARMTLTCAGQCDLTWTEDRVPAGRPARRSRGRDRGRAVAFQGAARPSLRDRHSCEKPSRPEAATQAVWSRTVSLTPTPLDPSSR